MFNRFAMVFHNAVDALAPSISAKDDMSYHWKAITNFFVDKRSDGKAPIETTNIPGHLEQILFILVDEEGEREAGSTGPCMEYLLQNKLLDTLYNLARADCPPGMKQHVLIFLSSCLKRLEQPLLPHINVHRPIYRVIKLCGEVKAAPTENEEIDFLLTVCDKIKQDPYLINFLIEVPQKPLEGIVSSANKSLPVMPDNALVKALLILSQSPDSHVACRACEGLLFCASLPVEISAQSLLNNTPFTEALSMHLSQLYDAIPKSFDPVDLDSVEAKWGCHPSTTTCDDLLAFPGKRQLASFLTWLDYLDQVVQDAFPSVGRALALAFRINFLETRLESFLFNECESGIILATAFAIKCFHQITSEPLVTEFGIFLLGESREPENPGVIPLNLKRVLLDRCNDPNDELCLITLKLFETLIDKPNEHILHCLTLANLLSRDYYDGTCIDYQESWSDEEDERRRKRSHEPEVSPGSSPVSRTLAPSNIHKIIDCFLLLLPEELKSSEGEEEMCYDSYLRDAHKQFRDLANECSPFDWPQEAISKEEQHHSDCSSSESQAEADRNMLFFEGSFFAMLFDKLEHFVEQSYEVNLQVTSILSKLAAFPHPNLHEFLLNPLIPEAEGARTLFATLEKMVGEIQIKIQRIPNFQRKLYLTRRVLLGDATDYSSVEGSNLLEGIIVIEEFCKELAAIAYVKYHASS